MTNDKDAGVLFNEDLFIYFKYHPDTDTVEVWRNGELISSGSGGGVTPEQLYEILLGYVSKQELAQALLDYVTDDDLEDYVTDEQLITTLADYVRTDHVASDSGLGLVKLNSAKSIYLNEDGQLEVGGRLGQFPSTTGLFAPDNREPRMVADYCFLITDVKGVEMSNTRALAVVSGSNVTIKSAPAGTNEYHMSNTYANRIIAQTLINGYVAKDEQASSEETIPVISVTINGEPFTPDSSPNVSSEDIIITTEKTVNPDEAIKKLRAVGSMNSYSTVHVGNDISSQGGGRCLLLGSTITKNGSGNEDCVVGQACYVAGNGTAVFGRYHISLKNRGFIAGEGHDTTNAVGDGVSAMGRYSYIDENTAFAFGYGTNHINRLNLFEILKDGSIVLRSPNGTRYKISVADDGTLSTSPIIEE